MKNRIIVMALSFCTILALSSMYFFRSSFLSSRQVVQLIDKKGFYVGDGKSGLEPVTDNESRFAKTVEGLNAGWENIRLGNSYDTLGQYEEAVKAYKKAYDSDPGNRIFSGRKLIETYEKLFRFDDALFVVDEILKNQPLGEYGIEKYTAIRTRLLAAKAQSSQN